MAGSNTIGSAFVEIGADLSKFNAAMAKVEKDLRGFKEVGERLKSVGSSLTIGLTAPIALFGASIIKVAGDFQGAMQGIKAITNATGDEFKALTDKAKELGSTTQFSATEAAQGIETLARNGLKAEQILGGAADASLALAAATGTNLANAADIATDAMLQFNFSASQLGMVADRVTGATVNSKFSIDDVRLALAQAGGVAGKVGVEFDDFVTTISATSSAFASGADAGTSFKTFLVSLSPKTKEAKALQEKLGISFFDSTGKMKSMAEISETLKKALGGMSEEQKISTAETLFGTDAMRTALMLADTGADKFNNLAENIKKVSAAEQAKTRMQGFNAAMKTLSSTFEGLQLAIADTGLLDFAEKLINIVTELIREISSLNPAILKWGTIIAGVIAVLPPLIFAIGSMSSLLPTFAAGIKSVTLAFTGLGVPLAPLLLSIAAVAAVAFVIYDNWELVSKFLKTEVLPIFNQLKGLFFIFLDSIKKTYNGIKPTLLKLLDLFKKLGSYILKNFLSKIKNALKFVSSILGAFESFYTGIFNLLQGRTDEGLKDIANFFFKIWNGIATYLNNTLASIASNISGFLGSLGFNKLAQDIAKVSVEIGKSELLKATLYDTSLEKINKLKNTLKELEAQQAEANKKDETVGGSTTKTLKATSEGGATNTGFQIEKIQQISELSKLMELNTTTANQAMLDGLAKLDEGLDITVGKVHNAVSAWEELNNKQFDFKDSLLASGEAFGIQATEMGKTSTGIKEYGKQLLKTAKANVSALIAEGIAAAVRNALATTKLPMPVPIILAGLAGGAAAALFNSIIPNFANGGIVSGETIARVGEYANARSNPEVIAPLSDLTGILNNVIGDKGGLTKEDLNEAFARQSITVNSRIGMTEIQREAGKTQYIARKGQFNV